jgi:hypothetical protein
MQSRKGSQADTNVSEKHTAPRFRAEDGGSMFLRNVFKSKRRRCSCSYRWGETVCKLRPLKGLLFIPQVVYKIGEPRWNDADRENRRTCRKTCITNTLSTTNPSWTGPGANPVLRGERLATNPLSHGTASKRRYYSENQHR